MSVRREQNEIVFEGFEKGIAQSPFVGIGNMRNVNTTYLPGTAYVNYKRQACTLSTAGTTEWFAGAHSVNVSNNAGWLFEAPVVFSMTNPVQHTTSPAGLNYVLDDSGQVWKQSAVNSTTFNLLGNGGRFTNGAGGIAYWNNYLVVFGNGIIEFCGDGTGDGGITGSNWNLINYNYPTGIFALSGGAPITTMTFSALFSINVGSPVTFSNVGGSLPAPLATNTTYYSLDNAKGNNSDTFRVSLTQGGAAITLTTSGSGTNSIHSVPILFPIGNVTNLKFTADVSVQATSATISSYAAPNGQTVNNVWLLASGQYNIIDANGNNILATFTNSSPTVSFISPTVQYINSTDSLTVQLLNPSVTSYRPYVSKVDGNLYFANGRYVGRILSENTNTIFNPSAAVNYTAGAFTTYVVDYGAFSVLDPHDSVTDMTDLSSTLIVSGQNKIYTWDYVSPSTTAPVPISDTPIKRVLNLLNNVYIFAGQKGNIYTTNGSYAQLLTKIPDYISGVIDPVWTFGGVMAHRSRIFFQALAQNTSGSNLLAGVFSLLVSPSLLGEQAGGITMEAQNSYGLTPSSGATGAGILIDAEPSSSGQDSYYSAWSNGASTGGIDYNNTTLWSNNEPTIETDIVQVGTSLRPATPGQVQFITDRPLTTGDTISLYGRQSLSNSWTLIGTTTTNILSTAFPSNLSQLVWFQAKATLSAGGTSFIPLRQIRIDMSTPN